jgi:signal peptidase I
VQASVGLLVAVIFINTWVVGGLVVPAVVTGSSMAPALLGTHVRWQCAGCKAEFRCDVESLPAAGRDAICPACGAANRSDRGQFVNGQRILVDRTAFGWRAPRRWEAVVLRSPENPDMLCVKRVVGLPGEVVDLRDGDVVVDGRVARKQLGAQHALAVAVAGDETARERWQAEREGTWVWRDAWCVHRAGRMGAIDWLVYHHAEPTAAGEQPKQPILDGSTVDQNESRRLNAVPDVIVRWLVRGDADGKCYLRARLRGDDFRLALPLGKGAARLTHNGVRVRAASVPGGHHKSLPVEVVLSDQRVRCLVAGKQIIEYDFEPTPVEGPAEGPALAIGAAEAAIEVGQLEVLRDVYYTHGPGGPRQYRLTASEYFVLGDNSPHSRDSRTWGAGGVTAGLLLGPALTW